MKDPEALAELYTRKWLDQMKRLGKRVTSEGLERYRKAARLMAEIALKGKEEKK